MTRLFSPPPDRTQSLRMCVEMRPFSLVPLAHSVKFVKPQYHATGRNVKFVKLDYGPNAWILRAASSPTCSHRSAASASAAFVHPTLHRTRDFVRDQEHQAGPENRLDKPDSVPPHRS